MNNIKIIFFIASLFFLNNLTAQEQRNDKNRFVITSAYDSYEEFTKAANNFVETQGYKLIFIDSKDGKYAAAFSKGSSEIVLFVTEIDKYENSKVEISEYQKINHNGLPSYFKVRQFSNKKYTTGELIVEFPKYNICFVLYAKSLTKKEDVIAIFDKFGFEYK